MNAEEKAAFEKKQYKKICEGLEQVRIKLEILSKRSSCREFSLALTKIQEAEHWLKHTN